MSTEVNPGGSSPSGHLDRPRQRLGGKSIWDWLDLIAKLAIPIVVLAATIGFGFLQIQLANQQHDSDQKNAMDQQHATTLQTYTDNIQDLLLHDNLQKASSLDNTNPYYDIAILARARTLTALQALDPERKGSLVQFLHDAQLIGYADFGPQGDFKKIYAPNIDLGGADLRSADLHVVHGVDLGGAYLSYVDLSDADLRDAYLGYADLSFANLTHALLTQQQLDQVLTCKGAILPLGLTCLNNQ